MQLSSLMLPIHIVPVPALDDNYIWIVHNDREAVIIDPGQEDAVISFIESRGLLPIGILITHQHLDHTEGAMPLYRRYGCPVWAPNYAQRKPDFRHVQHGDTLTLLGLHFEVIATPGHTGEHISYSLYANGKGHFFCGDTLFSAGCGRPFIGLGGSSFALFHTFQAIQRLPEDTLFYPAHEYTLSNIEFALKVEPDNVHTEPYRLACVQKRALGMPTLPTSLAQERLINPFLRAKTAQAFHSLRERKNQF